MTTYEDRLQSFFSLSTPSLVPTSPDVALTPPVTDPVADPVADLAPATDFDARFQNFLNPTPTKSEVDKKLDVPKSATPASDIGIGGSFARGVARGGASMMNDLNILDALVQTVQGDEQEKEQAIKRYLQHEEEISKKYKTPADFGDAFDSAGNFSKWVSGLVGENVPVLASILLGAGVVSKVGSVVMRKMMKEYVKKHGIKAVKKKLATAGAFAVGTELGTSEIAGEQATATKDVDPTIALGGGTLIGALESATPLMLGKAAGLFGGTAEKLSGKVAAELEATRPTWGRIGTEVLKTSSMEAVTETAQEVVAIAARKMVDENYPLLGKEARDRLVESGLAGFFVGGAFGGAVHTAGKVLPNRPRSEESKKPLDPGDVENFITEHGNEAAGVVPEPVLSSEKGSLLDAFGNKIENFPDVVDAAPDKFNISNIQNIKGSGNLGNNLNSEGQGEIAVLPKSEAATNPGQLVFLPGEQAAMESARVARDPKDLVHIRATNDFTDNNDVTARVEHLNPYWSVTQDIINTDPEVIFDPNASKEDHAKAETALKNAGAALSAGDVELAAVHYKEALDLGVRVEPVKGQGFILLNGFSDSSNLEFTSTPIMPTAAAPEAQSISPTGFSTFSTTGTDLWYKYIPVLGAYNKTGQRITKSNWKQNLDNLHDYARTLIPRLFMGEENPSNPSFTDIINNILNELYPGEASTVDFTEIGKNGEASSTVHLGNNLFHHLKASAPGLQTFYSETSTSAVDLTDTNLKKLVVRMTKVATLLHKTFLPKTKFGLIFEDQGKFFPFGIQYGAAADNVILIHINLGSTKKDALGFHSLGILHTLVHEFGHAISRIELTKLVNQKSDMAAEFFNMYQRDFTRGLLFNKAESASGFLSGIQAIARGVIDEVNEPALLSPEFISDSLDRQTAFYYSKFEEWMAENFAQWAESSGFAREPMGGLEQYFKLMAKTLTRLYKKLESQLTKRELKNHTATSPLESFLEYVKENARRQREGKPGFNASQFFLTQLSEIQHSKATWHDALGITHAAGETVSSADEIINYAKNVPNMPKGVIQNLNTLNIAKDYFNSMVKYGWTVLQLAQKNPHVPWLRRYVGLAELWQNTKTYWSSRANDRVREWGALGKEEADNLAEFIYAIDAMEYLNEGDLARLPTQEELSAMAQKYKLTKGSFQLYFKVREDFLAVLDQLEASAKETVRDTMATDNVLRDLKLAEITKEFTKMRNRPYFPHSRFGRNVVRVTDKNGKTVHIEHVEGGSLATALGKSSVAVRKTEAQLKKIFPEGQGFKTSLDLVPEQVQVFRGLPPTILQLIKLNIMPKVADEGKRDEIEKWIDSLIIEAAPANSFRKRLARRKNTAGFSKDALRSYADYFWHTSNHLARITYGTKMADVVEDFRKAVNNAPKAGSVDVTKRRQMVDFLDDHLTNLLNPGPDWAQLRSVAFMWWLGFSPASAVLNFTQVPIVTAPHLSVYFGYGKSVRALGRAMRNLRKMYGAPDSLEKTLGEDDAKLLTLALQQNIITESMAMELAGTAEGSNMLRVQYGTQAQRALSGFASASGWLFQGSEKINRLITFRAAVELLRTDPDGKYAKELRNTRPEELQQLIALHGLSEVEATAFLAGKDTVQKTQYEYAAWARPRFMRGRKSVLFTFYMFTQNTLWFSVNSPANKRMLLTMLALGGVLGLPGAEDMEEIATYIGKRLFGRTYSVEHDIREALTELFGSNRTGDLLLHGASREGFGLPAAADMVGLPFPSIDMSGSIGMGSVVPGLQEVLKGSEGNFDEALGRAATDIAGASFGVGINMFKFLADKQLPLNDPKRWERAMPRALKNITKAMRYVPEDSSVATLTGNFVSPEGRERTRTGSTVIPFESSNPDHMLEIAAQAMGFNPTRLSREWSQIIATAEVVNYWELRRGTLMTQFWHTMYTEDAEARSDVRAAIRRYNASTPYPELRITAKTLKKSMRRREKVMLMREHGVEPTKMYRRLAHEVDTIMPSKNDVILEEPSR